MGIGPRTYCMIDFACMHSQPHYVFFVAVYVLIYSLCDRAILCAVAYSFILFLCKEDVHSWASMFLFLYHNENVLRVKTMFNTVQH